MLKPATAFITDCGTSKTVSAGRASMAIGQRPPGGFGDEERLGCRGRRLREDAARRGVLPPRRARGSWPAPGRRRRDSRPDDRRRPNRPSRPASRAWYRRSSSCPWDERHAGRCQQPALKADVMPVDDRLICSQPDPLFPPLDGGTNRPDSAEMHQSVNRRTALVIFGVATALGVFSALQAFNYVSFFSERDAAVQRPAGAEPDLLVHVGAARALHALDGAPVPVRTRRLAALGVGPRGRRDRGHLRARDACR